MICMTLFARLARFVPFPHCATLYLLHPHIMPESLAKNCFVGTAAVKRLSGAYTLPNCVLRSYLYVSMTCAGVTWRGAGCRGMWLRQQSYFKRRETGMSYRSWPCSSSSLSSWICRACRPGVSRTYISFLGHLLGCGF